jgi:hypothetical protein
VREVNGKIHQLVVNKLDAAWSDRREYTDDVEDWGSTTDALTKDLEANSLQLEDGGGALRVI